MVHVNMPRQTLTAQAAFNLDISQADFSEAHDFSFSDVERVDGKLVHEGVFSDGYILKHKTANAYSYNRDKFASRLWHIIHRRQLVKAFITSCTLMKDGQILNSKISDGYSLRLSYETSGTIASVNHLFTLGSVRR
jgi:hypothetical protein